MGASVQPPQTAVAWRAQDGPQTALIACPVFEVFFGGARGGGKTDGVLGDFIRHADMFGENAIGLMVRLERTQLVETIERSRMIYGPLGWKYNEQDKMWRAPNGARLRFAYLERDQDADQYQGHSYSRVYVEEIGTFPSDRPILKLMATLRSGAGVPCGFRATGNPGGPGHHWVKARYIDPAPLGWTRSVTSYKNPWTGEVVERDRVFIPSKLQDNRYLGAEYVANLQMTGSENLVKAWLEGDWSVIDGAYFPEWSTEKHVIAPFTIPDDWLRFRSGDWGSAHPFSIGWWAVAGEDYGVGVEVRVDQGRVEPTHGADRAQRRIIPKGAIVRYREWYGASAPNIGLKPPLPAEDVARGILAKETGEKIAYGVIDPAAYASDGGPSIAERMAKAGVVFRRADNKRVAARGAMGGWDQMRARLRGDGERPMLYVFSTCRDLIRTLPALQHDVNRPEDVDTDGEDHAPDEARYACMSRPYQPVKREPEKPKHLVFMADESGRITANKSVLEIIMDKQRQLERNQ
ncbi:MAG: terminase family protein [Deltaproteobacteria bacterium]|nr:terminase family protein [Deltaproteobacteria bacterium]